MLTPAFSPGALARADRVAGVLPDPYRVWLSEVMLQQTTVAAVKGYYERFTSLWPDVAALAAAEDGAVMAEWAGLGYYARARNLLACARAVAADHSGTFPDDAEALRRLPGIGPYTAAPAIASIAFDRRETVVDGNVERVISRLFRVETPLPVAKPELTRLAKSLTPDLPLRGPRASDDGPRRDDLHTAQSGLWHLPRNCALSGARRRNGRRPACEDQEESQAGPPRLLPMSFARADGAWLLERRPGKGPVGAARLGWPGSEWGDDPTPSPPLDADWTELGEVRHTFTHFHLRLRIFAASVDQFAPRRFHSGG